MWLYRILFFKGNRSEVTIIKYQSSIYQSSIYQPSIYQSSIYQSSIYQPSIYQSSIYQSSIYQSSIYQLSNVTHQNGRHFHNRVLCDINSVTSGFQGQTISYYGGLFVLIETLCME